VTARVEGQIFTALCDRFRSPTQVWQSMSLAELAEATGLAKEALEEALCALGGTDGRDDSRIAYGAGRVVLGAVWRVQCRDLPNYPGPDRPRDLAPGSASS
jgi:hypothetical protein